MTADRLRTAACTQQECDDVPNVVAAREETGAHRIDAHVVDTPIELVCEHVSEIERRVLVLHAHQWLPHERTVPQLPESIRLAETELPVLLLAEAVGDG